MTPASECSRLRTSLAYLTLCVAVLLGSVGIRWYFHAASTSIRNDLKNAERDAAVVGNEIIVNLVIGVRTTFATYRRGIGFVVGFCLLGVGVGLLLCLVRMWLRPSAQTQVQVSFPRPMLIALTCQVGALWVAGTLAITFLYFLARVVAF